jgi:hypothetical protein
MPVARRLPGWVIARRTRRLRQYVTGGVVMAAAEVRC